jgi:YD repeat-containing protein
MSPFARCGHYYARGEGIRGGLDIPTDHVRRESCMDRLDVYMRTAAPGASRGYPYAGIAYANPDAVTQIANGLSTTSLSYDADGNLAQKTVDGTYLYDYANRLIAIGTQGATTTYAYDAFGVRVLQTGT